MWTPLEMPIWQRTHSKTATLGDVACIDPLGPKMEGPSTCAVGFGTEWTDPCEVLNSNRLDQNPLQNHKKEYQQGHEDVKQIWAWILGDCELDFWDSFSKVFSRARRPDPRLTLSVILRVLWANLAVNLVFFLG